MGAMSDLFVAFDPAQPAGEKLPPEVVTEIVTVSPSTLNDGQVTTAKLANDAVTNPKIAAGAVGAGKIATNGVVAGNLADDAVDTDAIENAAVTPEKTGAGVLTIKASDGQYLDVAAQVLTVTEHDALPAEDPTVLYLIVED